MYYYFLKELYMVKITLRTTSSNGNSKRDTFNLNSQSDECIRKIIDLIGNGYQNNNNRHNISLNSIGRGNNINTRSKMLSRLARFTQDTNLIFTKPNNTQIANNNIISGFNNNNFRNNIISGFNNNGGMNKEYITLQSGGRRLVKYGKRGGRYYIKGGNKIYLK